MPEHRQSAFKLLWGPVPPGANGPLTVYVRVKFITAVVGLLAFVLAAIALLSALFLHLRGPAAAGVLLLAVSVASSAVREGFRLRLIWSLGQVTGWKQEPIRRHEQPARFWIRLAIHAALCALPAMMAAFLIRTGLDLLADR